MNINGNELTETQVETLYLALIMATKTVTSSAQYAPADLVEEQLGNLKSLMKLLD
jgi:hypothetical protein